MALTLGQALHAYVGEPEAHHYLSDSAPSVEDRVDNVDHTFSPLRATMSAAEILPGTT